METLGCPAWFSATPLWVWIAIFVIGLPLPYYLFNRLAPQLKQLLKLNQMIGSIILVTVSVIGTDVIQTKAYQLATSFSGNTIVTIGGGGMVVKKNDIRIPHSVYHHTFSSGSTATELFRGNKYTIYTNSLGFKDKSPREVLLKSEGKRILFIGDSFTEGVTFNYEDTFVGIIDSNLSKNKIEVLNAGRSSYSPIIYLSYILYRPY